MGSSDFVERVLKQADEHLEERYRLQSKLKNLIAIVEKVAEHYEIDSGESKTASKERTVTEARRAFCNIAVRKMGYKCSDVARALGIGAATVSKAASLGIKLSAVQNIQKEILVDL